MKWPILFVTCAIFGFIKEVISFSFITDYLIPRMPIVTKVRSIEDARTLNSNEVVVLDTVGLIERYGYPTEEHNITTDDGYNIVLFRITGSPKLPQRNKKPVVYLQHGLMSSSDSWVLMGSKKDLAFLLADAGYDVWLGNLRGNSYGRSHNRLSPSTREFWNFSFHDHAIWDLTKTIDYALKLSGRKSLSYVGHSMGSTISYILLSERPEYNEKINLVVSLAPIAYWTFPPRVPIPSSTIDFFAQFLEKSDIWEVIPQTANNIRISRALCSDNSVTQDVCISVSGILGGYDPLQFNKTLLPYVMSYYPAGGSTKTLIHYHQNLKTGYFQQFDLGSTENYRVYGTGKPPMYDVQKITAPVALIYGKNDALSIEPNVAELSRRLQNIVTFEPVPYDSFNHPDFQWANDAKELLYDRLLQLILMYNK